MEKQEAPIALFAANEDVSVDWHRANALVQTVSAALEQARAIGWAAETAALERVFWASVKRQSEIHRLMLATPPAAEAKDPT